MKTFFKSLIIIFLFASLSFPAAGQDTVVLEKLSYENNSWNYQGTPFNGTAVRSSSEFTEYYQYVNGKQNGYHALFINGDTAAVHTYNGNMIHLVFYTKEKKKTLEYNQQMTDQTYMVGEWKDYRDDGSLQVKGNYKLIQVTSEGRGGNIKHYTSVKDGIWEFYDGNEKVIKREIWKNDKLIRTRNLN